MSRISVGANSAENIWRVRAADGADDAVMQAGLLLVGDEGDLDQADTHPLVFGIVPNRAAHQVANGTPFRVIAEMLHISLRTLRKYFRVELDRGRDEVVAAIGGALVRAALGGNVHAMRYWLMCRGARPGVR